MTAKRIGPNFAGTFAGKIWSNHLCCHFLPVTKEMMAQRIGPNSAKTVASKNWSNPLCCHFIQVAPGHASREDWTKFCQDSRGQNLIQSSLLSFPTGNQAERTGPNFARTVAGKIWSNPLCCHFLPVTKLRGLDQILRDHSRQNLVQSSLLSLPTSNQAERIGTNFARPLTGKIWSNPLCCQFLPVTKDMTAERIGPDFAGELFSVLWLPHVACLLDVTEGVAVPNIVDVAVLVVVAVVVILLLLLSLAAVAGHSDCQRAGGLELMLKQ